MFSATYSVNLPLSKTCEWPGYYSRGPLRVKTTMCGMVFVSYAHYVVGLSKVH